MTPEELAFRLASFGLLIKATFMGKELPPFVGFPKAPGKGWDLK